MDFLLFYALFYKTFSSYFLTNEVLIHLYQKEEREKENKEWCGYHNNMMMFAIIPQTSHVRLQSVPVPTLSPKQPVI